MLKNYFLVAFRNLKRHKGYSFINITGFAVGIACCILLALYVNFGTKPNFETYVLLEEGFDYRDLEGKFPALLQKYAGRMMKFMRSQEEFFLQPLRDIHLRQPGDNAILYVYVFSVIALFVLLIACVNFMNLSL